MDIQVGAKIVANLKSQDILSSEEAERLIAYTNNSGPLFILGTVGISLLNNSHIGYILLISHLVACFIVGLIFRNWKKSNRIIHKNNTITSEIYQKNSQKDFGEILNNSIKNSIIAIVNIGGFIIFFSVIISILNSIGIENPIISGIIELTSGVKQMSLLGVTKINICIISFLIGFGGLSVLFQVHSIIVKENISIKPYFYGKFLQGILAFLITGILFNI